MLTRVLEPEVMDDVTEAHAYDALDHAEVNRQFVDDLLATGALRGELLDLGTGTALIPIALMRRLGKDADLRVTAIDASLAMLDVAQANLELADLVGRLWLEQCDAKALPFDDDRFAIVISNSLVHHVADPIGPLREAHRVTAPGGRLFFRDLLRPEDEQQLAQLVATYAGDADDCQRRLFADSLRAALRLDEVRALVAEFGAPVTSLAATSDRHWTWSYTKPN